jgi:hypothetical protein
LYIVKAAEVPKVPNPTEVPIRLHSLTRQFATQIMTTVKVPPSMSPEQFQYTMEAAAAETAERPLPTPVAKLGGEWVWQPTSL